jgi:phosphomannomutase
MQVEIKALMQETGVAFGTSGARGLAAQMTDRVCYAYAKGFLQYLQDIGELAGAGAEVAVAGDLRPSTGRIMAAVAHAASDMGYAPLNCGRIPSPAVALYGLQHAVPAVMVTGSHIPADRNGIKFNKTSGEILKTDEAGITSQQVDLPSGHFLQDGSFVNEFIWHEANPAAGNAYVNRYLDVFPRDCLAGKRIGLYQHSAVGRELLLEIFEGMGAEVTPLGFSDTFVPVDTEAIREEDVTLALEWSVEYGLDAIFSTDGDSDRPLISNEHGVWLRGDVAGILAAAYLEADSVHTPVSCNTALELTGWFEDVRRTRIGSPYVIASMTEAGEAGRNRIVGYEANGGFLTNSSIPVFGGELRALPTRDAVLPVLAVLLLSIQSGKPLSQLVSELPPRYTLSDRIQNFPTEESRRILDGLSDEAAIENVFGEAFGAVQSVDRTDGVRITFDSSSILHLRPSGNAPEFRCYAEAGSPEGVAVLLKEGLDILKALKG